jgi:Mg/Co/Ni transporter MgtE
VASDQLRRLLDRCAYEEVRDLLAESELELLATQWSDFKPLDKLTLFKLLAPARAFEFFSGMDVSNKYFLLCAFELESIAPVLEKLAPAERSLFVKLPAAYYDRMLHQLCREQIEIEVAVGTN